ncbi:hypothetical protein QJS04_geneDACA017131 [Acorus gramineus]|uniref:Uncharacterized protein n=1 Tax=Acorus gramineus TaxID=55184 RepID=A0AAV9AVI7_ACOGR|nr:hypothetical protein QJS04_geneDACA017131 [Acorus gramineus]
MDTGGAFYFIDLCHGSKELQEQKSKEMEPLHKAPGNANNVVREHTMSLSSSEEELTEGSSVFTDMRTLIAERRHEEYLEQRKKEKEPLPMALRELRNSYNPIREEGMGLCSSEEELNKLTEGALVLAELRPIIAEKRRYTEYLEPKRKEMKPFYTTPGDFRDAINAVSEKDMGLDSSENELIELQLGIDFDAEKKELQPLCSKIKSQDEKMKVREGEDEVLNKDHDLRKAGEDGDITGLEALSGAEFHRFMSQFSSYKEFREDYERQILSSEKPILSAKAPTPNESEMPEKEETNETVESGANGKVEIIPKDSEEWIIMEKSQEQSPASLELKREEELAKAN